MEIPYPEYKNLRELTHARAMTPKVPGLFAEFAKNLDDCSVNITSITSLMNCLKVPSLGK